MSQESKTWEGTLKALNLVEAIDLIVPVVGQAMKEVEDGNVNAIISAILGYEQYRAIEEQYIYGIFGEGLDYRRSSGDDPLVSMLATFARTPEATWLLRTSLPHRGQLRYLLATGRWRSQHRRPVHGCCCGRSACFSSSSFISYPQGHHGLHEGA